MAKYTTLTGRAVSPGRTRRAPVMMRTTQRGQERPLPISLSVHPKALTPTSRNPHCMTMTRQYGITADLLRSKTVRQLHDGNGLHRSRGAYRVFDEGTQLTVGYTDDPVFGLAYANCGPSIGRPKWVLQSLSA